MKTTIPTSYKLAIANSKTKFSGRDIAYPCNFELGIG